MLVKNAPAPPRRCSQVVALPARHRVLRPPRHRAPAARRATGPGRTVVRRRVDLVRRASSGCSRPMLGDRARSCAAASRCPTPSSRPGWCAGERQRRRLRRLLVDRRRGREVRRRGRRGAEPPTTTSPCSPTSPSTPTGSASASPSTSRAAPPSRWSTPALPLERATAGYDLLVNVSYRSHGRNGARRGIYVVHFPDRPGRRAWPAWQRRLQGRVGPGGGGHRSRSLDGFHEPDTIRWQQVRWTNGRGVLRGRGGARARRRRSTSGSAASCPAASAGTITVARRRRAGGRGRARPPRVEGSRSSSRCASTSPCPAAAAAPPVEIVSEADRRPRRARQRRPPPPRRARSWASPSAGASLDPLRARASLVGAEPVGHRLARQLRPRASPTRAFTQRWIAASGGARPSDVLEPPVGLRAPGRQGAGHPVGRAVLRPGPGPRQEAARAGRGLPAARAPAGSTGWELHLVGGCSPEDRPYLDEVAGRGRGPPGRAPRRRLRAPRSTRLYRRGRRSTGTPPGWARTSTPTRCGPSTSASPPSRPCRPAPCRW